MVGNETQAKPKPTTSKPKTGQKPSSHHREVFPLYGGETGETKDGKELPMGLNS